MIKSEKTSEPKWYCQQLRYSDDEIVSYRIFDADGAITVRQVLEYWQRQELFRKYYIKLLASAEFHAYFWEMPPLTKGQIDQPFEFVLVNSPELVGVKADTMTFRDYFTQEPVVGFKNLAGDAFLVAPTLKGKEESYSDLACFSRHAAIEQQHAFWQYLAEVVLSKIDESPLWLSTSGLGVYWLHVRLDNRPKYYNYLPYKQWHSNDSGG